MDGKRDRKLVKIFTYIAEVFAFIILLDSRYMYLNNNAHWINDSVIVAFIIFTFTVLIFRIIDSIVYEIIKNIEFKGTWLSANTFIDIVEWLFALLIALFVLKSYPEIIEILNLHIKVPYGLIN